VDLPPHMQSTSTRRSALPEHDPDGRVRDPGRDAEMSNACIPPASLIFYGVHGNTCVANRRICCNQATELAIWK
jgi:hypothetical protein